MRRVIVVGAGVVGLSCAVRLLEAGHRVDVLARDLPLETTSAVAAALWYPYRALPQDRVTAWSATSYDAFRALAEYDGTGVRMLSGTEVLHEPRADPWWVGAVPALVPELAGARVLQHRVGLRPVRPSVRVERVGDVVHCYGQGGAGVTLSWGCADEVARLAEA